MRILVMSNYISGALTSEDRVQIAAAIATIREKLPFMLELPAKTKRGLPKMGDKSRAFVQKAFEVGSRHPDYLPGSIDLEELRRDIELFEAIYPILMDLNQLQGELNDTLTAVGSDAYSAALQIYRIVKAHGDGSGLDTLVDDMGRRFGRKSRKAPQNIG
jgi:hypothetical protein